MYQDYNSSDISDNWPVKKSQLKADWSKLAFSILIGKIFLHILILITENATCNIPHSCKDFLISRLWVPR